MADFLTSQLDYVYFVAGLALMLLGAVAASIPRTVKGCLPWGWLAAFAWVHGAAEWLHLARPAGGNSPFLVGSDGRVLVSGVDAYQGRRMWPAPVRPEGADAGQAPLVAGSWTGTGWVSVGRVRHVAVRMGLPALDWSVVTIRKESLRGPNRLLGIVTTLLLSLVIVASFVIAQRQLGTESRLAQEQKEAEGRAREMARRADTDVLTGIANRQGFNEVMSREFAGARRFRHPLSIVILDLDHFKRVNDQHGHPTGDQVLVATARLLSTRVRESDLVARWGGEEIAIIASVTDAASQVNAGDAAVVRPAMANLTADHFAHEEELMRRRSYPSRARHEEAHTLFVGDARRFHAELDRGGITPAFRQWAASRLPDWFRYHTLAHDVALGKFLLEDRGPGPPGIHKRQGVPT